MWQCWGMHLSGTALHQAQKSMRYSTLCIQTSWGLGHRAPGDPRHHKESQDAGGLEPAECLNQQATEAGRWPDTMGIRWGLRPIQSSRVLDLPAQPPLWAATNEKCSKRTFLAYKKEVYVQQHSPSFPGGHLPKWRENIKQRSPKTQGQTVLEKSWYC